MPTAKVTVKKTTKNARRPARKTVKKVFIDDRWEAIEKGFVELHELQKETAKAIQDTHRNIGEFSSETRKAIEDTRRNIGELSISHRETEKAIKETQRNIGGLNNTMGSLVEHVMTPGLPRKFKPFGFTFDRVTTVKWADGEGNIYTEIDGLLENGDQAMVVEVKTTLRRKDIDEHLERMERVRKYADAHGDKREFLGAIATMIANRQTKEYALSKGFFIIEPSGEDVRVIKPSSDPRVW